MYLEFLYDRYGVLFDRCWFGISDYLFGLEFYRGVGLMLLRIKSRQSSILFLNEKLVDLYLALPEGPLVDACRKSNLAYAHALKIVKYWASLNLIISNKSGVQYNFFYTGLGQKLSFELMRCRNFMKKSKIQWISDEKED